MGKLVLDSSIGRKCIYVRGKKAGTEEGNCWIDIALDIENR